MANQNSLAEGRCGSLVKSLSVKQRKYLTHWLQGPQAPHGPQFFAFWDAFEKAIDSGKPVFKEEFAQQMYPESRNPLGKLGKDQSQLKEIIIDFLATEELNQRPFEKDLFRLNGLKRIGATKNYKALLRYLDPSDPPKNCGDFKRELEIERHKYDLDFTESPRPKLPSTLPMHMALDNAYAVQKLRLACLTLNQDQVIGSQDYQQINILDAILMEIKASHKQAPTLIHLYLLLHEALKRPDELESFQLFRKEFLRFKSEVATEEQQELEKLYLNQVVRQLNRGKVAWQMELKKYYEMGIEKGSFENDRGEFHQDIFKNIVLFMGKSGEMKWLATKGPQLLEQVPEAFQERAMFFLSGVRAYFEGNFREAIRQFDFLLSSPQDIFYSVDGRIMLIKALFEAQEWDILTGKGENSYRFSSRNKRIPLERRKKLKNFIDCVKRLASLYQSTPAEAQKTVKKLREQHFQNPNEHYLDWCREKLVEWEAGNR